DDDNTHTLPINFGKSVYLNDVNDMPSNTPYPCDASTFTCVSQSLPKPMKFIKDYPHDLIIGDPSIGFKTKNKVQESNVTFLSKIESKNVKDALQDENWIATQEELEQFARSKACQL
ncbi:hypothetical protein JJ728_23270, partial [Salmonella enterica subsp. enterica serovar Typhi]|uniref:hypothetical protein n=1 Tax=Salmonella enterica TaxID=28901 RepID=UPI00191680A2